MNRVQMAIMRANRQRMEQAMQSHRNQRAVQQNVQRPTTVQRPGGVEISMRAIQQDAKQHVQENSNADGSKRQAPAQNRGQEISANQVAAGHQKHSATQVKAAERAPEQGQSTVQREGKSLQSVKNKQQEKGQGHER